MDAIFQWEWLIIELIVLGLCVRELWVVRAERRRDAEAAARRRAAGEAEPAERPLPSWVRRRP